MEIEQWVLRGGSAVASPPALLAAADAVIAAEAATAVPLPSLVNPAEAAAIAQPVTATPEAAEAEVARQPSPMPAVGAVEHHDGPGNETSVVADRPDDARASSSGGAARSLESPMRESFRAATGDGGPPAFWDDIPDDADYPGVDDDAPLVDLPEDGSARRRREIAALDWEGLQAHASGCQACGLCSTRKNVVFGVGPRSARVLVIGEAPGADEDASGEPFVGQAGKLLDAMLAAIKLDRRRDVYIANVLKCRPPRNRDPLPEEVHACSMYLSRQAELLAPELVLLVGRFAAQAMLATDANVGRLRGHVHSVDLGGRRVPAVVSYHPAYLLRSPAEKSKSWADLCMALEVLDAARTAAG